MSKVFDFITQLIIEKLDENIVPWKQPWFSGLPKNISTKNTYRGINILILSMQGYDSPWWMTYNQMKQKKGMLKPEEHYTPCVFWKPFFKDSEGNSIKDKDIQNRNNLIQSGAMLRYYRVFNLRQTIGIKDPDEEKYNSDLSPIENAEKIVENYPNPSPEISREGDHACYKPNSDEVIIPPMKKFESSEKFYGTLFHELIHSTGHQSRLDRLRKDPDWVKDYSREELVAEMGACFLQGTINLNIDYDNSVSYIDGWRKRISEDRKLIIEAASAAQKAVNFILGENSG